LGGGYGGVVMKTVNQVLIIAIAAMVAACSFSDTKTAEEFGKHFFELIKKGDAKAALKYKLKAEDAGILAERIPNLFGMRGVEYPSDKRFLDEFEDHHALFDKEKRQNVYISGLDRNTPIHSVEYKAFELGQERVFAKGISFYKNSYIIAMVNGQHKKRIRIESLWNIEGWWRILELD
jgi:hypothetical protein